MSEPNMTLELVKSRASILPEGSVARLILEDWAATGVIDEGARGALCFELLMRHGWDGQQLTAIMRAAVECAPKGRAPGPAPESEQ